MDDLTFKTPPSRQIKPHSPKLLIILKGYPRVSETFVAQEILGLQNAGLDIGIVSLRHPYDAIKHPVHDKITAPVHYLPEALCHEPLRVCGALFRLMVRRNFWAALRMFFADLRRDCSTDRVLRFGQALVLAAEVHSAPKWLYAHFAHTPTSVTRYASKILGVPFSVSAHAKDIWTTPDWDLKEKLQDARWTVTCTKVGYEQLKQIAPKAAIHLNYHGLDLSQFSDPKIVKSRRDGRKPEDPVRIVSVGRAVAKKGYDTLLTSLAKLPPDLHWCFEHIGHGPELEQLKAMANRLGLSEKITWRGQQGQAEVLDAYRRSDIFVLASRKTPDSDRDGLPNVLVEAASQRLACVATDFSAIPELIEHGASGLLVPTDDAKALTSALSTTISNPNLRIQLGETAATRVREEFDYQPGIQKLVSFFENGISCCQINPNQSRLGQ